MEEVSPDVRSNVKEVAGHKDECILAHHIGDPVRIEAKINTYKWNQIHQTVADHCFSLVESTFQQDSYISHLSWNLMRNNANSHRHKFIWITKAEGNPDSKAINEIMEKRTKKIQKSSRFLAVYNFLSLLMLQLSLLLYIVVLLFLLLRMPMRMRNTALLHETFNEYEGENGCNEGERDILVREAARGIGFGKDVHCFT